MKTIVKLLLVLCAFATTAAFGQVITWIGTDAALAGGANMGHSTNWSGNSQPLTGTIGTFDGTVPGNLIVFSQDGINGAGGGNVIGGSFGAAGTSIDLTPTQIGSVSVISKVASAVGMGFDAFRVQSGAGQLTFGDGTANQLVLTLRPTSGIHAWINNSANPVIINPNMQIQHGGGSAHTLNFQGTGNFTINNNLRNNNNAPAGILIWDSTGTTTWTAGGVNNIFNGALGTITINAGTVIVKSAGLIQNTGGANTIAHNGTLLNFDAAAQTDTMVRLISGAGPIQVNNGTWTFSSGGSTFSGAITLSGGTLIAGGTENVGVSGPLGVGGTISFTGGTLGWNVNNVFDYSARFSTAAGQAYNLDTGGQNVMLATGLGGSSTLTKLGGGTLTLSGTSSYSGATTVSAGKLVFQGSKTGTGSITVADGTALGVTASGTQVTPATLTAGTSGGVTLEFNNVNSIATAPLAPSTLSSAGTTTININSGTLAPGQSYPLLAWTTGTAPAVSLGVLNGFIGNLSTNGNSIQLNVTATAYFWTGITDGNWDLTTANNWSQNGGPVIFANGGPVLFDDSSTRTNVTVNALVQPTTITVSTTNAYSIASSGGNNIGGSAKLTKIGSGLLTLSGGANTYTGITTAGAGTLSVGALANGSVASDIGQASSSAANLVLDGGTVQYTGASAASIDRLFTLTTSGGAIDSAGSVLAFTNTGALGYTGNGARTLTLTGTNEDNNTLASVLANNGGATAVTKSGPGKWILTGNNSHSGVTLISGGALHIGAGGGTGSPGSGSITDNGSLVFNRTGSLTVGGVISGNGSVSNDGSGTVILSANNTYSGGTTINAGTLQVGSGGGTGSLNGTSPITNNSTLDFNTTGSFTYLAGGAIGGTGNVIVRGNNNLIKAIGPNSYTGWTRIDAGATFQPCEGNQGALVSSVVTNNGTLKLVRQDLAAFFYSNNIVGSGRLLKDVNNNNDNDVTLLGVNTYTNGTIIAGGQIVLGDGVTAGVGSIVGNVIFTNSPTSQDVLRALVFNRPDDVIFGGTFSGNGGVAVANSGRVEQRGTGKLTLTGSNTHRGGALVTAGTLLVNGASTGTGTVTVNVGGTLGGTGTIGGNVDVAVGGILAPGASIGTLTISSNLNIAGDLAIEVNKSLAQSNDVAVVSGGLTNTGTGTLTVANLGPALVVGDKFTLFSKPVQNGAALTITGGGGPGWINNLAVDGSIVVGISGPTLNFTQTGNSLEFSWGDSGYKLQAQTNSLSVGISNNWGDYPGGGTSPVSVPIDATQGAVFFRLISTP